MATCDDLRTRKLALLDEISMTQASLNLDAAQVSNDYTACVLADTFPPQPLQPGFDAAAINARIAALQAMTGQNPMQIMNAVMAYQTLLTDLSNYDALNCTLQGMQTDLSSVVTAMYAQNCDP